MMIVTKILMKILLMQTEIKSCDDDLLGVPKKLPFWNSFIIGPKSKKVFEKNRDKSQNIIGWERCPVPPKCTLINCGHILTPIPNPS